MEIAATCYDMFWNTTTANLRTDMIFPEGIIHFWSNYYNFQVGYSLSSTNVSLIPV